MPETLSALSRIFNRTRSVENCGIKINSASNTRGKSDGFVFVEDFREFGRVEFSVAIELVAYKKSRDDYDIRRFSFVYVINLKFNVVEIFCNSFYIPFHSFAS